MEPLQRLLERADRRGGPTRPRRPAPRSTVRPAARRGGSIAKRASRGLGYAALMHALVLRQLTKVYENGIKALKAIDLDVDEGDFFALLGPNGAGKTDR